MLSYNLRYPLLPISANLLCIIVFTIGQDTQIIRAEIVNRLVIDIYEIEQIHIYEN